MDVKTLVSQLSEIERKTLSSVSLEKKTFDEIVLESNVVADSVRRALQWLFQKGLILLESKKQSVVFLEKDEVLAERKIMSVLSEKISIEGLRAKSGVDQKEFGFCLGKLKNLNIVAVSEGKVFLTEVGKDFLSQKLLEEKILEQIKSGSFDRSVLSETEQKLFEELLRRHIVKEKESSVFSASLTENGVKAKEILSEVKVRAYNIFDPVPEVFGGKRQPYAKFLEEIRSKLVEMGFKEMKEQLVTQEFYNFDVLFQPQNHPARTWTDTYRLRNPKSGDLPVKKKVAAIKAAHESGGKTSSRGWGGKWEENIAMRLMPNAHGTSADARQMIAGVEYPSKYFVINRCYRPDVLDATHLVEFNQLDGFIVGPNLSFPNLLGILKDFAVEIAGAKEVKFFPDYYPFTEPSVQLSAKHPKLGWIEFAGAGIFRPEITENLGIKGPVLAWGMGVDRLAMFKLGISDIRHLFSQDIEWLRKQPVVVE